MAGYVLADVEWVDQDGRARYVELLPPSLERFGGKFVVGTSDVEVEEGDWEHRGVLVLIRFPSLDDAVGWYRSSEYEPALKVRQTSARSRLMIFEGD